MNLTKKQEKEIFKVYDTWLHSYLNGDVATYDSFLDDHYHFIGSTDNEEFLNRKDTTNFFKATADQLAGKADVRNEKRVIEKFGGLVILTHVFDAWFLNKDNWSYYGRFRFTSTLQEKKEGWRFIYQHFSTTDAKAEAGETIGFDQVSAENLQLREAVKRRTVELEEKNRELEVETALERIRSQAVAMKESSDLLDIVVTMRNEFIKLGHEAHYFWHMMWLPETYEKAMTSGDGSKIGFVMELPRHIHGDIPLLAKWEKSKKPTVVHAMNVQEALDYVDKMVSLGDFQNIDPKAPTEDDIRHIGGLTFIMARTSHGEIGYSLPGIVKNPPKEDIDILVKFAGAFDLAHRRFLDLQKAENQAREVEIELALEKVRSRTMAMQNSEELKEVIQLVYDQFVQLNINIEHTGFILDYKQRDDMHIWLADKHEMPAEVSIPYFDCAHWNSFNEAKKKDKDFFANHLDFKEKNKFYKDLFEFIPDLTEDIKEYYFGCPGLAISTVLLENIGLYIENFEGIPYTNEENDILIRFGKVFQQTYTRFLDLQKAEAQAREAKIEAALEKIRSRTMAMQKGEELQDVVVLLYKELITLGVTNFATCGYVEINEKTKRQATWVTSPGGDSLGLFHLPLTGDVHFDERYEAWKKQQTVFHQTVAGKERRKHLDYAITTFNSKEAEEMVLNQFPDPTVFYCFNFSHGYLHLVAGSRLNKEEEALLARFTKVFEQTYARFLDLQKAEAQAREAQIEASLEKVRSRSTGMQKSEELREVIQVIHDQLIHLNFQIDAAGFTLDYKQNNDWNTWIANKSGSLPSLMFIPYIDHPQFNYYKSAKEQGLDFLANYLSFEDKNSIFNYMFGFMGDFPQTEKDVLLSKPGLAISQVFLKNISLWIYNLDLTPYSKDENDILKRFAKVFEQIYVRFNDLKKAEAQSREAQIEAAIEKVRSKTMAMHNSSDVEDTVLTFFGEVLKLGLDKSIRCGIGILEGFEGMETRSANIGPDGEVDLRVGMLDMTIHPMLVGLKKAWKKGSKRYSYEYTEEDVYKYYEALNNDPGYPFNADLETLHKREFHNSFFFSSGIIFAFTENPISEESSIVLSRFADVFGQTYRRYLDLRKAEAQAKEAQIEAALEKVRARTMAMQKSQELPEAANNLFLQVQELGIPAWSAGYCIWQDGIHSSSCNMSTEGEIQKGFILPSIGEGYDFYNPQKAGETFYVKELGGEDLVKHYDFMKTLPVVGEILEGINAAGFPLPTFQIFHIAYFKFGYVMFITYEAVPEAHDIFKRFTQVFEQTFTRFLDLEKAENQSKEAQIELALERVRASSMAMHKSEQLAETAEVLFEQFDLLGIIPDRMSIAIFNQKKRIFEMWSTDQNGIFVNHGHDFSIDEPTVIAKAYKGWKEGKETLVVDLKGKELEDWVRFVKEDTGMELDESEFKGRRVHHIAFFSQGFLILSSHLPVGNKMIQLLLRFAKVFEQTYTRFLDLLKAETNAREAIKHASVDRVRAEIASMRTATDLKMITPLVWNELKTLDVPFIRCGVFIMDEELQQVQTHLSTPDGKAIASFDLPFDDTAPLTHLMPHWRKKEMYKDYWDESGFIESINILMQRGAIASSQAYMTENQPTNLHLHFLPFLQGMLYVGSEVPLTEDELNLAQNLADAFSTAYSRYEDFNKLELANKKIEKTLVDLKQTQSQLIQSEKMASLGELTAGIAHEIQNPLNFVNNFSEVSYELMKEMQEEMDKGDLEEAREIGNDIEQNLEKINHHGQRASEIVKGMLQHSRSSSGVKEDTDLNALADEYLRLAYHGLRAKDKTFNAKLETEFDEKLEKINVVPQDIGRVILNLITNAFYAVNEKKQQQIKDYEPKVTVHTKKTDLGVEISVKDNGNGIPEKVLEKIFQPFFTTKPTGKGTGLGLSLSYDIVKAHGGDLKAETKEGEGTEFTIQLPI